MSVSEHQQTRKSKRLTLWSTEMHHGVVVFEHVHFFNVIKRLHAYPTKNHSQSLIQDEGYLPNFLIAALSFLSSCTAAYVLWEVFFWTLLWVPTYIKNSQKSSRRSGQKPECRFERLLRTFTTKLRLSELRCEPCASFSNLVIHLILILNDNVKIASC